MARYLADEPLAAIYASSMKRAQETAAPLAEAHGLEMSIVDDIAEFDRGLPFYIPGEEREPMNAEEMTAFFAAMTSDEFAQRVERGLAKIIAAHPGETVAAVCHGGVISNFLAKMFDQRSDYYFDSHYTAVTRIRASAASGRRTMVSFNECHWLRDL